VLRETQHWDPEALQELQFRKLIALVRYSYERVPYYRAAMRRRNLQPEHIRDFDDYRRLPLLTRRDLRDHQAELLARPIPATLTTRQSSGSTGERVQFQQDRDFDLWCDAHQLRTYEWCGAWRLGEPFVLVWGAPAYFEARTRRQRATAWATNRVELNGYRLDRPAVDALLERAIAFQPMVISGYTTALYLLARAARERQATFPRLRAVQPNAEPLNAVMRAEMEEAFDCEVFDKYGSRETNIVAHESPGHDGMCIQAEHTYVEFLDDRGDPCQPGETGRLVLTTLNNRAMPLLRYETSDLAAPLAGTCRSGVTLPRMTPVLGRRQDVLRTPDGGLVHPQLFSNVLRQFPAIEWFQVVQQQAEALTLRVVAPGGLPDADQARITRLVRTLSGFDSAVTFDLLSDMPPSRTGKFRLCVSELPQGGDESLARLNRLREAPIVLPPPSRPATLSPRVPWE
jgi:phenylacetate-CoA ligase